MLAGSGYLTSGADRFLAEFGFKIAMPALLFRATSTFAPLPTSPVPLLSAYFLASASVWVVVNVLTRHVLGRPTEDAPPIAMACCFGNTVMLGILASFFRVVLSPHGRGHALVLLQAPESASPPPDRANYVLEHG